MFSTLSLGMSLVCLCLLSFQDSENEKAINQIIKEIASLRYIKLITMSKT